MALERLVAGGIGGMDAGMFGFGSSRPPRRTALYKDPTYQVHRPPHRNAVAVTGMACSPKMMGLYLTAMFLVVVVVTVTTIFSTSQFTVTLSSPMYNVNDGAPFLADITSPTMAHRGGKSLNFSHIVHRSNVGGEDDNDEDSNAGKSLDSLVVVGESQQTQKYHDHDTDDTSTRRNLRFVFGIYSMDSPIERIRRQTIRETYLSYYKLHLGDNSRNDTICSLSGLMENQDFINDRSKCQFVYTFVIGGGDPKRSPARCFWGDTTCAGTFPSNMTLAQPESNFSHAEEYSKYNDITFLNIRESMNDGKTETWFSYISALISLERPDLGVDFVGRLDSDAIIGVELLLQHYRRDAEQFQNDSNPYLFGGSEFINCSETMWVGKSPGFTAPGFFSGGMMILSSQLAYHAYLDGTVTERMERSTKTFLAEDMLTAMFAFRDPNITVRLIPLLDTEYFAIFLHSVKSPEDFAKIYWYNIGFIERMTEDWHPTL